MIDIDKLSLPVCALGATAAHVVVLGLVLPMSIKLPQASESMTPMRVAISVEIAPEAPVAPPAAQPEPAQPEVSQAEPEVAKPQVSTAQPDTINALLQNVSVTTATTNTPEPVDPPSDMNDITGSLPEAASVMDEAARPSEVVPAEIVPTEVVADEIASDEVAEVDEVIPPLPTRVRRDAQGNAIITVRRAAPKPVRRTARATPRRPATPKRAAGPFQGAFGGLFGKPANNRAR